MSYVPSLKKLYVEQVIPELSRTRGYKNRHQVPRLVKIAINTGIDADADKNQIADIQRDIAQIAGQKPVLARSRKAIANFKLKQGQVVGCHVTLRGDAMWEFLCRLLVVALPTIRDFRGVPSKFDGQGNYNLGITDHSIFPEITASASPLMAMSASTKRSSSARSSLSVGSTISVPGTGHDMVGAWKP